MKIKTSVIKHLICALVMFATMFVQADLAPLSREEVLRMRRDRMTEWSEHQNHMTKQDTEILQWAIPCGYLIVFLAVLVVSACKKKPSYLAWLSCSAPIVVFLPVLREYIPGILVLYVAVASWLLASAFFFFKKEVLDSLFALLLIPIVLLIWQWLVIIAGNSGLYSLYPVGKSSVSTLSEPIR